MTNNREASQPALSGNMILPPDSQVLFVTLSFLAFIIQEYLSFILRMLIIVISRKKLLSYLL